MEAIVVEAAAERPADEPATPRLDAG
jgi:hypothetical protein